MDISSTIMASAFKGSISSLEKNSLPARNSSRADTHTPFKGWAGAGLAGQILAGSHFSAFDQTQAWLAGPESLPGRDISKERARALERLVGESVWDCELGGLNTWSVCVLRVKVGGAQRRGGG